MNVFQAVVQTAQLVIVVQGGGAWQRWKSRSKTLTAAPPVPKYTLCSPRSRSYLPLRLYRITRSGVLLQSGGYDLAGEKKQAFSRSVFFFHADGFQYFDYIVQAFLITETGVF